MARRIRLWCLGILGGLGLLAVLLLPPGNAFDFLFGGFYYSGQFDRTPAELVEASLGNELRATSLVIKRQVRLDTIRALLADSPADTGGVLILLPPGFDPDTAEALIRLAERELARPAPRSSSLRLALVGLDWELGSEGYEGPSAYRGYDLAEEWYMLPAPTGGYCVVLLPLSRYEGNEWGRHLAALEDPARNSQLLGPCRYYGRYGPPGPDVGAWLRAVGHGHAQSWALPREAAAAARPRRSLFGPFSTFSPDLEFEACLAGRVDLCRNILSRGFVSPDPFYSAEMAVPRNRQLTRAYLPQLYSPDLSWRVYGAQSDLMSHLERWYGEERFQRFWSSEEPLEVAFQDAFGASMGEWVLAWGRSQTRDEPNGPGIPPAGMVLTLGTLLALAALVALVANRRQVA